MTQDEIIEMAKTVRSSGYWDAFDLINFAKLVAEKEREACAKLCEDRVPTYLKEGERWLKGDNGKPDIRLKDIAPNLEAVWEAEQLLKNGGVVEFITESHKCANAIRARGQA